MPETLIKNANEIVLREQDEIQEIIGHPPSWILRWGVTVVLFLVVLFGLMSWLIKYPDVLSAPVIITTENPVIRVVAKVSAKLEKLSVKNQEYVEEGQIIALLESNTDWEDIQKLNLFLQSLSDQTSLLSINIPEQLSLGQMQASYTRLVQQVKEQQYFLQQTNDEVKIQAAQQQIQHYEDLNESIKRQLDIFQKEVQLAENNYKTSKQLFESGAGSLVEVENAEANFLQYQRQLEGLQAQMISNRVTGEQLKTQIADIGQNRQDGKQNRQLAIEESVRSVKNEVKIWEQTYLIKSPIEGQISMVKVWSPNQFVQANTEIFTIIPKEGAGAIIAKAMMPTSGIGKVKKGMEANINLEAYPQQEYGILRAKVKEVALLPEEQQAGMLSYLVTLDLEQGLLTTYEKKLSLQQEMAGTAEIITEDKRILERVLEQVLNILKNN